MIMNKKFVSKRLKRKALLYFLALVTFLIIYQNWFVLSEYGKHYYHQWFSNPKEKFDKNHDVSGLGVKLPEKFSIYGIDISKHQGLIDWDKVDNQYFDKKSFSFVFLKATEGYSRQDPSYDRNWEKAKNTSMYCGAYHFYRPGAGAKKQAKNFIKHANISSGDLAPVLDVEKISAKYTIKQHQDEILSILKEFEREYKISPIIYTNTDVFNKLLNENKFSDYPIWIAKYHPDEPKLDVRWKFWQFTEKGIVDGIDEFVDINVFRGSLKELKQLRIP